jgi:hypothetical protein
MLLVARAEQHLQKASMGPPLISGGNRLVGSERLLAPLRFNGAAADQRRK